MRLVQCLTATCIVAACVPDARLRRTLDEDSSEDDSALGRAGDGPDPSTGGPTDSNPPQGSNGPTPMMGIAGSDNAATMPSGMPVVNGPTAPAPSCALPELASESGCNIDWPIPNASITREMTLRYPPAYDTRFPGVVLDQVTGLMWQRNLDDGSYNWVDAQAYCADLELSGYCDWRLPTRIEWVSIIDYTRVNPAIDSEVFPDTPATGFWSSSPLIRDEPVPSGAAWQIDLEYGGYYSPDAQTDTRLRARCVRTASSADLPVPPGASLSECYSILGETVWDNETGLEWQRSIDSIRHTWEEARLYCSDLALSGVGWRVPTVHELQTIVDDSRANPAVDTLAFPESLSEPLWTSSLVSDASSDYAWTVGFDNGATNGSSGLDAERRVRCVR